MGERLPDGVRSTTLPCGARVVTETMPDVRSVAVGFWIGCGSRDEQGAVAGASHFLEHLLFKGTGRRSAQQIAESVEAVGGDLNAFTSKEYTCFYVRCLDRDLELAVDVLGDMVTGSRIRPADVDAERDVVLEEIHMHLDTPDDLVHSVFSAAHFGDHPLGREVLGTESTITAMRRDQVNGYYLRQYVASNLVIAAAGNLEHERVVELVGEALADVGSGEVASARVRPETVSEPRTAVLHKATEQAHIVLGGAGLARGDDRRWSALVLNNALGGGMASRLFQEVRERRGLVYSVYSFPGMHADAGTFAVYAGTAPAKLGEVLQTVRDEFSKTLDGGLSEQELERARGALAGSMVLNLEDTGSRMNRLGKAIVTGTPLLSLDEMIAAVGAVTPADVAAIGEVLLGGPFTLAVVGPTDGTDADALARYTQPMVA